MRSHEQHLSDEELLLSADGEPGERANRVRTHLEGCVRCRTRAAEMENALTDLACTERRRLDGELPPIAGPRAMLRTRLAELSGKAGFWGRYRLFNGFPAGAVGMAAVAAVLVFACVVGLRYSATSAPVSSLLSSGRGILPDHFLTPGAARRVSLDQVCSLPHEEVIKDVSQAEKERVFAEYRIGRGQSDQYEIDYLITPGLGGDDDIRNLWPEPSNAVTWNAHVKDVLEERLHEMVCSHQLDLSVAQAAIATNWIAAYEKYVQPATSNTQTDGARSLAAIASTLTVTRPAGGPRLFRVIANRKVGIQEGIYRPIRRPRHVYG
jgi:hypothetical protein